jgi:LacI family transcriptional regulator
MDAHRPTLRSLAAEAGVSPMTVSLALRNSPTISAERRAAIQQLAAARSYRPDPAVTKLMHHLRTQRPTRFRACLAGLSERWSKDVVMPSENFSRRLRTGLQERAERLGYTFELFHLEEYPKPAQLRRVLQSRGIEGIVLMPLFQPRALDEAVPWDDFAAVSVSSSVLSPAVSSVMPRHFDNLLEACSRLRAAGYRRIGLAISRNWDVRVNHRWTGAMAWHNAYGGTEPVPAFVGEGDLALDPAALRRWMKAEQPDAIIAEQFPPALWNQVFADLPRSRLPALISTNWPNLGAVAGIDQRVEVIGATAIDVLSGMLSRGEKGLPRELTTTVVHGRWVPGTLQARHAKASASRRGRTHPRIA